MKKRARGKREGRAPGARRQNEAQSAEPASQKPPAEAPECPVVLSISPQGVTLPGGAGPTDAGGASADLAHIREQLEAHARDVEQFVRAQRFNSIVTRVLADLDRHDPPAPVLRLRKP